MMIVMIRDGGGLQILPSEHDIKSYLAVCMELPHYSNPHHSGTLEGVSFQPKDVPVGPVAFRLGAGRLIPGLEEVPRSKS